MISDGVSVNALTGMMWPQKYISNGYLQHLTEVVKLVSINALTGMMWPQKYIIKK